MVGATRDTDVAWGDMPHFMPYVAQLNPWFPAALIPLVGWIATIAVFAAAAAAFLLAGARPDRWSVDGRRIIS